MLIRLTDAVENAVPRGARRPARSRGAVRTWRRSAVLGISALTLGTTAPGASAQIAPGYSGFSGGGIEYMGNEEVWQALRVFGSCYARVNAAHALELLGHEPGTPGE